MKTEVVLSDNFLIDLGRIKGSPLFNLNRPCEHEVELGCLPANPSKPTVVLSDLSGNYSALLDALVNRGFVSIREYQGRATFEVTDLGKGARLILAGDTNDRLSGFFTTTQVIDQLRKQDLEVVTLVGNHELSLISTLIHKPPKTLPVKEYQLRQNGQGPILEYVPLSNFEWFGACLHWINKQGGKVTIDDLAAQSSSKDLNLKIWSDEYLELLGSENLLETLGRARNTLVKSASTVNFFNKLKGAFEDNGIYFVHAGLPVYEDLEGGNYTSRIKSDWVSSIQDPGRCWKMGMGVSLWMRNYENIPDRARGEMTQVYDSYYGRFGSLVWDRLPRNFLKEVDQPKKLWLPESFEAQWLEKIKGFGVQSIVRGHDPAPYLGASMQSLVQLNGISILNCEACLDKNQSGYTYISPEGIVFARPPEKKCDIPDFPSMQLSNY